MSSIRRKLTAETVNNLVSSARVNSLVTAETVNSLVTAETVNSLVTAETVVAGSKWVGSNSEATVNIGAVVIGATVAFNDLGNVETGCGVTWSGTSITIRNSSGKGLSIAYLAVTE